jgi:hypothetical protein
MKSFHCTCGQLIFFENVSCMHCGRTLGFLPDLLITSSLEPADNSSNLWVSTEREAEGQLYKKCQNYEVESVCNWMIPPAMSGECFCVSCRLNLVIPDLSLNQNRPLWASTEGAKRRLIYSLLSLRLPLESREDNPTGGLGFKFLANTINVNGKETPVLTGHEEGIITLNIAEADDIYRERTRLAMNEPYRTLVGHFRHEIGHYYWDRIVRDTNFLFGFRDVFGDEREDYDQALKRYYSTGAPADWQNRFISVYATAHPWEDWAETWAHYLHISDTLEVASNFGLISKRLKLETNPSAGGGSQFAPKPKTFDEVIEAWAQLSVALNSINRSMGLSDIYPFVLSRPVVEKLRFISEVIAGSEVRVPRWASGGGNR